MNFEGKVYVSDILNGGIKGHANYAFVDVLTNNDVKLFIDPMLLEHKHDIWHDYANRVVQSFFDEFYSAYKSGNVQYKKTLLAHACEQNATRLGYGVGDNGKGNTAEGLLTIFRPLEKLILDIPTIKKPEDLTVLIPNFAEDGLSDLLTNILHRQLNEFTILQLQKYSINTNGTLKFWTWNYNNRTWEVVEMPSFLVHGKELLLVPKDIVRKNYLFDVDQYFRRVILERMREEGNYYVDDKPVPKNAIIESMRFSGPHWQYDETIKYTQKHSEALSDYHRNLPGYYLDNGWSMSDDELDEFMYGDLAH